MSNNKTTELKVSSYRHECSMCKNMKQVVKTYCTRCQEENDSSVLVCKECFAHIVDQTPLLVRPSWCGVISCPLEPLFGYRLCKEHEETMDWGPLRF